MKIFVTYGDENYYSSLNRLKNMAIQTGIFDEVKIFTDKDLPEHIKSHELMKHKKGGGYWLWKPWCILEVMKKCSPDDIVVYSDSGNEIYKHQEWDLYFLLLQKYNAIFFKNGGIMSKWCRKETITYFKTHYPNRNTKNLEKLYQLNANIIIATPRASGIFNEWWNIMCNFPNMVVDVRQDELPNQYKDFYEHRHDQAVLTCVVYSMLNKNNILIRWQHSEFRDPNGQAVFNARISDTCIRSNNSYQSKLNKYVKLFLITPYRNLRSFFYMHF